MDQPAPRPEGPQLLLAASSAGLLFAILESLPFRVAAYDLEGRYVLQNQVSLRDFGALVGRRAAETSLPADYVKRWEAESPRALAGEVVWGEQQIRLASELHIYRYLIAPIRGDGIVRGTVSVDIDITDQRRAEQALLETHRKLRQREAELAHLDRVSTMGQMASELAHELSQPLYAINNFAEACLGLVERPGELNKDELLRWLAQIGQQARRGGDVLRRITHFIRKGELNRQPFDLNHAVHDVLAMLDIELSRQAIEIRLQFARMPLMVEGDALLLEQVLINLIRNAKEAMQQQRDQRVLTVRTFAEPGLVGAAVSDTGPGLPTEQFNHVFESYFTTKAHGTGLGLAICRSTIEAHRGRIWASNQPGGGATFRFVLPAADNLPAPAKQPASSS